MSGKHETSAKSVLAEIIGCGQADIALSDDINSLKKWDSLNHMRLIMLLEEKLDKEIETEDAMSLFSVKGIAIFLEKQNLDQI